MSNSLFIISCILITIILISLNYDSMYGRVWLVSLNEIEVIGVVDIHHAYDNYPHGATIGNMTIIDENSVKVTFNNKNDFTIYSKDGTTWGIPEQFEFVKIVNKGDIFIEYCNNHRDLPYLSISVFELAGIDVKNNNITINHYNALLSYPDIKCKHPEIIQ